MADSSSNIPQLSASQANQELRINELVDALSPSSLGGRNAATTSGLVWGWLGGDILVNGVPTSIANGTVTLPGTVTRFIEISQAGVISASATRTAGSMPLYQVTTNASTVTSYTDERNAAALARLTYGQATVAMADANQTLSQAQALCESISTTGALTATRDLIVPLVRRRWVVRNNCTGNPVRVIGASGTGITIAVARCAIVESDGTNVIRLTADSVMT